MFHWGCFEKLLFVQLHSDPVPSACATTLTYWSKFESVPFEYGCFEKWIGENHGKPLWKSMDDSSWEPSPFNPPKLDRSETAIHPYVGSPTGEKTGPLADSWTNPSFPQGVILKVYSISICDVCQRSPPRCSMIKGKMWVFGEYHPGSLFSENLPRLKSWNITHT